MLKSHEELVEKCKEPISRFGNDIRVYLEYLPFKYAKEYITYPEDEFTWDTETRDPTEKNILHDMKGYIELAWRNVMQHDYSAAVESIDHLAAWLWILGDTELYKFTMEEDNFGRFAVPILEKICTKYNFLIPDGPLVQNMIKGKPCCPTCAEGCIK